MILEYKNNDGYIYAYISWNIIDRDNKLDQKHGTTIAVSGTWIHEAKRGNGVLKMMINDLFHHSTTQKTLYLQHGREKYNRPNRLRFISRYLKYIGGKDA